MAYFPQFGMQQQMGMAPMRQDMQYRSQPFQGFQGMQGLQGLQRLLGGLGGREDFALPGTGRSAPLGGGLSLIGQLQDPQARQGLMDQYKQQLDDRRNNLQKDYGTYSAEEIAAKLREDPTIYTAQEQRSLPQPLGQGIGGREDAALPGTGQTQPAPAEGIWAIPLDHPSQQQPPTPPPTQTTMPVPPKPPGTATQIGAPPLTPTKIPPGTGGVKPAPPPASTPPPPGQIGAQPQAPTPLQGAGQPTPPQAPTPPQQQVPPQEGTPPSRYISPEEEERLKNTFIPHPMAWQDDENRRRERIEGIVEELPFDLPNYGMEPEDYEMGGGHASIQGGTDRWGNLHGSQDYHYGRGPNPDQQRSPWGRGPSRQQPFPFLPPQRPQFPSFPPMMPRFGGGMPRGMGMPYGGGGPYGNLWGGGGGFGGGWGQPQMPRFGGGFGGGMGGIGGFPGMGGGGFGGGFGGGYGMPQMPRFGGGFGGGMPGFGGGFGGGMRQPQNRWNVEPPYDGGFGGMQELFGGGW